ncbi:S1 RNA-binding domain-containing protein, partial [Candidatus Microgenomates bacterium]|nr:S1 RNA-binding domain-containing protein [Candidatus Microgenomates bacterium]
MALQNQKSKIKSSHFAKASTSAKATADRSRDKQNDQNLSSKSSSVPTTMEELLAHDGTISAIGPSEILIDIKGKTEGIVLEKDKRLYSELLSRLSVGSKVKAVVISAESDNGHPVLSLRRELLDKNWTILLDKKEKGEEVEVTGVELTRGGLLVEAMGLRGFIPLSHLEAKESPESYVGIKFKVKILDLDRKERRIVFSQKAGRLDTAALKALLGKLKIGEEYQGI